LEWNLRFDTDNPFLHLNAFTHQLFIASVHSTAAAVVLAMVIWGVAYSTALKKNAGVSETLVPNLYASEGYGKLGISFW